MVAFKRFFQADRGHSSCLEEPATHIGNGHPSMSPNLKGAQHHFHTIERQFELMHDQLQAGPQSPRSQAAPSRGSSRLMDRAPRHVDLVEALFSSHRYHMQSTASLSPISPYNEDIAERNMATFLQTSPPKKKIYSRIISALYQEDVADRNIARSNSPRPVSRSKSIRSRGRSFQSFTRGRSGSASRSRSRVTEISIAPTCSNETPLRQQRSTPILSSQRPYDGVSRASSTSPERHLGVPPAHKQGDTWRNAPLPDSPTLPMTMRRKGDTNENQPTPTQSSRSSTPLSQRPAMTPRSGSKKNVRDLSINTELAARGGSSAKIAHRAIQPPTPTSVEMKQNPSIAEVMNSPLPPGTPMSISSSSPKVAEIMDMFRQAYASTQPVPTHPTFETLQEAIVREINSHEAFQRVPVPNPGPPFTPSPIQLSFDSSSPSAARTLSLKRPSFKKPRRDSDARRSISTSVPSKVFRRASSSDLSSPSRRRRHTDAPPPSPGLLLHDQNPNPAPVTTYMDILLRSQKSSSLSFSSTTTRDHHHHPPPPPPPRVPTLTHSHSSIQTTISSHGAPDIPTAASPSVFCMRAHTSASSSSDSHPSLSLDDDSDEEVIQLPSVGVPHVQIHAVDENNVAYLAENTSPQNAYRLMNWPRKLPGRSVSLRGDLDACRRQGQVSVSQRQRQRPVVRGVRSVESY
ncbi:hypothetical protein FE257_003485 [Aspergillus nanangensis]|uniref:Uncharacterized protein n=1 Tax=Aspergillus nanangensis TaxID=2582783 RepID=A0AAD4CBK2_ASPNN|nr:hypothetical protein FE257_003485 [Aspergillus nanangensis]